MLDLIQIEEMRFSCSPSLVYHKVKTDANKKKLKDEKQYRKVNTDATKTAILWETVSLSKDKRS